MPNELAYSFESANTSGCLSECNCISSVQCAAALLTVHMSHYHGNTPTTLSWYGFEHDVDAHLIACRQINVCPGWTSLVWCSTELASSSSIRQWSGLTKHLMLEMMRDSSKLWKCRTVADLGLWKCEKCAFEYDGDACHLLNVKQLAHYWLIRVLHCCKCKVIVQRVFPWNLWNIL